MLTEHQEIKESATALVYKRFAKVGLVIAYLNVVAMIALVWHVAYVLNWRHDEPLPYALESLTFAVLLTALVLGLALRSPFRWRQALAD